jgi:hypothetical protein
MPSDCESPTLIADLERRRHRAMQEERDTWARVKGKYPGQTGHDAEEWRKWECVANKVQALSRQLEAAAPARVARRWRPQ